MNRAYFLKKIIIMLEKMKYSDVKKVYCYTMQHFNK